MEHLHLFFDFDELQEQNYKLYLIDSEFKNLLYDLI